MKIPKRLTLSRSCFIELPVAEKGLLTGYELEFRRQYGGIFHSRIGFYFFFELPHAAARNAFIHSMEVSYRQQGVVTKRETIFPE